MGGATGSHRVYKMKPMTSKNTLKGASFTYAFRRINESIESGYYLEAVTLSESIISDRLLSFVKVHKKSVNIKTPFHQLIQLGAKYNKTQINTKSGTELFDALDTWRIERNTCVHSASKSEPGQPTVEVSVFEKNAEKCAKGGKVIARLVCDWDKQSRKKGGIK